ncbi:PREDICTED: uncharacterized protein LOC104808881 [Tarenaya hassleriana]|uniref:uncharacterized protein LOC104808881 n=1 Tax=Tarenaya hassleriana TaxID=28532 RepID=UPI00053C4E00|nr:PREDICTED: uncharacterized protein LOC104808881 [Tarenaya hassleriana]
MADVHGGGLTSVPSLPPPVPRSPSEMPDFGGKRRRMAKVQKLEREIGILQVSEKNSSGSGSFNLLPNHAKKLLISWGQTQTHLRQQNNERRMETRPAASGGGSVEWLVSIRHAHAVLVAPSVIAISSALLSAQLAGPVQDLCSDVRPLVAAENAAFRVCLLVEIAQAAETVALVSGV